MKGTLKRGRAAIVVLGDFGRSPRMQYHALSLANQADLEVDVIGYAGSQPHQDIISHEKIHLHLLNSSFGKKLPRFLYLLSLPFKILFQTLALIYYLCFKIPAPDFYILQNPPTIPTFTVLLFASWLRGSHLIIDWHNFGFTLLALSLGKKHPLVRTHEWYERKFGPMASAHLCVTKAMADELALNWGIQATVLYDRPPSHFQPITIQEKHKLLTKLHSDLTMATSLLDFCSDKFASVEPNSTILTIGESEESLTERPDRPAVIISSTSWTPDEDFGVLLESALLYDRRVSAMLGETDSREAELGLGGPALARKFPDLLFLITGKGPQRELFEQKISRLRLRHVAFRTLWTSLGDYSQLLACCDLGLSLHSSSSQLDLPMKVVDMLGCGIPVAAMDYACIGELVKSGENGLLFKTSFDLAKILLDLFEGFPERNSVLPALKRGAVESSMEGRWNQEWESMVLPLLESL